MAASKNEITTEEIIALLKKSTLPTIVVEGNDDMIVYRTFETKLAKFGVSVLPVGGRKKVLEVFKRRVELPIASRPFFIADQDTWVTQGVPAEYVDSCILFTHGYSIENDIYIDGELRKLLREAESVKYSVELTEFIEWYALALDRHFRDPEQKISLHPKHVLNPDRRQTLLTLRPAEIYPVGLRDQISFDYQRQLRGKSLIELLLINTNYTGRVPQHSKNSLLEAVAVRPGALLNNLFVRVEQHFSAFGG